MGKRRINKVAVIGSGIMGSGIACHFANIGVDVLLLDIVPRELNDAEKAKGLSLEDKAVRNRLVNDSLKAALKSKPSPIYHQKFASRITTGNLEDDIAKVKDVDWIIEVVVERLDIKKIVFENQVARSVITRKKGKRQTFSANKEIILCGGVFNSPQLLMLSGIGDATALQSHGIDVVNHLPGVGKNLQDHISLLMNYPCSEPLSLNAMANSLPLQIATALNYFLFKKGAAACSNIEAGVFYQSRPGLTAPDIQLHAIPSLFHDLLEQPPREHGLSIRACNLTPYSRGFVDIRSVNPDDAPKIDFNFLADERDLPVLIAAYKLVNQMCSAKVWRGSLGTEYKGGTNDKSDEDIVAFIRQYIETDYHPVGTCKMGNDDNAVVDADLKVKGVAGLRVADASIMPTIIRGNTNIPCMMIGDKAASLMLST